MRLKATYSVFLALINPTYVTGNLIAKPALELPTDSTHTQGETSQSKLIEWLQQLNLEAIFEMVKPSNFQFKQYEYQISQYYTTMRSSCLFSPEIYIPLSNGGKLFEDDALKLLTNIYMMPRNGVSNIIKLDRDMFKALKSILYNLLVSCTANDHILYSIHKQFGITLNTSIYVEHRTFLQQFTNLEKLLRTITAEISDPKRKLEYLEERMPFKTRYSDYWYSRDLRTKHSTFRTGVATDVHTVCVRSTSS